MSVSETEGSCIELLDLTLNDIFPQWEGETSFDVFPRLFQHVLPNFDRVEFILAEVLELQRYESRATTHIYSYFDDQTNEDLIDGYFRIVEGIIQSHGWSLSKLDNMYFGNRIWCASIIPPGASVKAAAPVGPKHWYEAKRDKKLDINYEEKEERTEEEILPVLKNYVGQLHELCLHKYAYSYVLLIPISLNSTTENSEYRAKLGAIFLHFATTEALTIQDLRRIYGRILLFWHYYFTSESLGRRQREIEQLKVVQELFTSIQQHTNQIRHVLHNLHKPLMNLDVLLSPVCGLIYGGESLESFFQAGGSEFRLNERMPLIKPAHDWSDVLVRSEGLQRYKDVIASVIFKVLGMADTADTATPLWEQSSELIGQQRYKVVGARQSLISAFAEYIPELQVKDPTAEQVERAFKTVKAWFNDSYKPKDAHSASLPYSFLGMAMSSLSCNITLPPTEFHSFWVASLRPVETIDAIVVLHEMQTIKEAKLVRKSGNEHLLEIWTKEPHRMDESNAAKLAQSVERALIAHNEGDISRRGNMTYVILKLFGYKPVNQQGLKFCWKDAYRSMSVLFDCDETDTKNKITIEWIGKVYA